MVVAQTTELTDNELFETLTERELATLAPICSDFVAVEGGVIVTEGRNASALYVVRSGQVAIQQAIRVPHAFRSRRTTIAVCRPGEVVGWSALVEPYKYTGSAVAWESCRLISVDGKMLRRALDTHPELGYKVMRSLSALMSKRLGQTAEALIDAREVVYTAQAG